MRKDRKHHLGNLISSSNLSAIHLRLGSDLNGPSTDVHVDDPPGAGLESSGARILRWIWPPPNRDRARAISQTDTRFCNTRSVALSVLLWALRKERHCLLAISRAVRWFEHPPPRLCRVDSSVATTPPRSSAPQKWHMADPSIFRLLSSSSPWPPQPCVHPTPPRGPMSTIRTVPYRARRIHCPWVASNPGILFLTQP